MLITLNMETVVVFLEQLLTQHLFSSDTTSYYEGLAQDIDITYLLDASIDRNTVTFTCGIAIPESEVSRLECVIRTPTVLHFICSQVNKVGLVKTSREDTLRFIPDLALESIVSDIESVTVNDDETVAFEVSVRTPEAA